MRMVVDVVHPVRTGFLFASQRKPRSEWVATSTPVRLTEASGMSRVLTSVDGQDYYASDDGLWVSLCTYHRGAMSLAKFKECLALDQVVSYPGFDALVGTPICVRQAIGMTRGYRIDLSQARSVESLGAQAAAQVQDFFDRNIRVTDQIVFARARPVVHYLPLAGEFGVMDFPQERWRHGRVAGLPHAEDLWRFEQERCGLPGGAYAASPEARVLRPYGALPAELLPDDDDARLLANHLPLLGWRAMNAVRNTRGRREGLPELLQRGQAALAPWLDEAGMGLIDPSALDGLLEAARPAAEAGRMIARGTIEIDDFLATLDWAERVVQPRLERSGLKEEDADAFAAIGPSGP